MCIFSRHEQKRSGVSIGWDERSVTRCASKHALICAEKEIYFMHQDLVSWLYGIAEWFKRVEWFPCLYKGSGGRICNKQTFIVGIIFRKRESKQEAIQYQSATRAKRKNKKARGNS